MSLMTVEVPSFLPAGQEITRADLEALPDDGHRYELIDGALIVTPAPRMRHQDMVLNLAIALKASIPSHLKVMIAPFDVALADDTVMQPDVLVASRDSFTELDLPEAPLLAIEVLSPSTRGVDLLLKKDRLQRAGCQHYWVVDPDEPSITALALTEGAYAEVSRAAGDEQFSATAPFEVTFTPASLLD